MPDTYHREQRPSLSTGRPRPMLADSANYVREQRAAIMAACLYPILFAAVLFCEVLPSVQGALAA